MRRPQVLQAKHLLQASASKRRPAFGRTAVAALVTGLLAACSAGGENGAGTGGLGPVGNLSPSAAIPYQHGNAISPAGFTESLIGENRYRIEVTGYPGSSHARMEKIAHTRAAEIGKEMRLRYFKVENLQHSTRCTKARSTPKGGGHPDLHYRVLTADVSYTKAYAPPDAEYRESRASFRQLRAELDQPAPPSPAEAVPFQCPS